MKFFMALSAGLIIFGVFCMLIQNRLKDRTSMKRRMASIAVSVDQSGRKEKIKEVQPKTIDEKMLYFVRTIAKRFHGVENSNLAAKLDLKMQQADWPLLGVEFLAVVAIAALMAGSIVGILTIKLSSALIAALGAAAVVLLVLSIAIQRRRKAFTNQLGDMLTMVANALRAGFSFLQAFELVAREMENPVKAEVEKVVRDINVGMSLEAALENMNKRICSPEFELVVTAVLIQRQVGGNMAQILDNISNTINERIRMRREIIALTSQGRASGIVLAALPFAAAAMLTFVNPGYMDPVLSSETGRMAIVGAIIMEIIGWLVIERIVNIEM